MGRVGRVEVLSRNMKMEMVPCEIENVASCSICRSVTTA